MYPTDGPMGIFDGFGDKEKQTPTLKEVHDQCRELFASADKLWDVLNELPESVSVTKTDLSEMRVMTNHLYFWIGKLEKRSRSGL